MTTKRKFVSVLISALCGVAVGVSAALSARRFGVSGYPAIAIQTTGFVLGFAACWLVLYLVSPKDRTARSS